MTTLKDPNQNPWYILMTLHGEQTGDEIDWVLHEKNRKLWNAWACQEMSAAERANLEMFTNEEIAETGWNSDIASAVERQFKTEFEKRNPNESVVPALPHPTTAIDLTRVTFGCRIVLRRAIFTQEVFLSKSVFKYECNFSRTQFAESLNATELVMVSPADFSGVLFCQDADFSRAQFKQRVEFKRSNFERTADFNNAIFAGVANFYRANFSREANFIDATFEGNADFNDIEVLPKLDEPRATFGFQTDFSGAYFGKQVGFRWRNFSSHGDGSAKLSFAYAVFDGSVSFENASFSKLMPDLTNCLLPQSTNISVEAENWPILRPNWLTRLEIWLRLRKKIDYSKQCPKEIKASSARLRHAMAKQMLPEEEHFFFRREMWAAARSGKILPRIPILSFEFLSDYGYSISRPLGWLLCLWLIGIFVYAGRTTMGWWDAAAYSFAAMFKIFGFQRLYFGEHYINALPVWIRVFGATQTVLGFILLFFLGLGLRTRFRLR
ncbi:pentapeptide repeat-containing protein [Yoonia sp. I 8.24]|uniref:pentapeptide repeat-containing protein n=1 Tax=Yoonia sp. I 8.24 TaxID=1537229 RepID=UPI001EDF3249|nr:pentapeptide repeat-containing protein [Yoonia sp. I 8.24]MCG3267813.1 pentapeptide repeat-containing protein [Yoonia sp. I 8.24]